LERLKIMKEPHLFGKEFPVRLETIVTSKLGESKPKYIITNVRESV